MRLFGTSSLRRVSLLVIICIAVLTVMVVNSEPVYVFSEAPPIEIEFNEQVLSPGKEWYLTVKRALRESQNREADAPVRLSDSTSP